MRGLTDASLRWVLTGKRKCLLLIDQTPGAANKENSASVPQVPSTQELTDIYKNTPFA